MLRLRSTEAHIKFWRNRKINWQVAYGLGTDAISHPHRKLIMEELAKLKFGSVGEMGCGAGVNLSIIKSIWPHVQVGGTDVNVEAIEQAKKNIPGGIFDTRSVDDLFFSDACTDLVLTDACLIYVGPFRIRKALNEIRRITRKHVVFVEFHSTSFLKRLALRVFSGYNAYCWPRLLEEIGFYDIQIKKIPKEAWSGTPWEEFGYMITASK